MEILFTTQLPLHGFSSLSAHKLIMPSTPRFSRAELERLITQCDVLVSTFDYPIDKALIEKALTNKDILKCNRIVDYFGKNTKNNPLVVTITVMFNFFSNLLFYHSLKEERIDTGYSHTNNSPFT